MAGALCRAAYKLAAEKGLDVQPTDKYLRTFLKQHPVFVARTVGAKRAKRPHPDSPPDSPPTPHLSDEEDVGPREEKKSGGPDSLPLPHHGLFAKKWAAVQATMTTAVSDAAALAALLLQLHPNKADMKRAAEGVVRFFDGASPEENQDFFRRVLPFIQRRVLALPAEFPSSSVAILGSGRTATLELSRSQVLTVLSAAFFGLLPKNQNTRRFQHLSLHLLFCELVHDQPQAEKVRCLIHYFGRMQEREASLGSMSVVTFHRRVYEKGISPANFARVPRLRPAPTRRPEVQPAQILQIDDTLLGPVTIHADGTIEDDGDAMLQVDFANK